MANKLPFAMQSQQQTEWCWAAVAASVAGYFGSAGPSGGLWQQCDVVNSELAQSTCCVNGASAACNNPWYLDRALSLVGHLAGSPTPGAIPFANVQGEVDNNRPVGVRIGWYGGGGHFVVLSGYDDNGGAQFVDVDDPWYGPSVADYSVFATAYQSAGSWTDTYLIS